MSDAIPERTPNDCAPTISALNAGIEVTIVSGMAKIPSPPSFLGRSSRISEVCQVSRASKLQITGSVHDNCDVDERRNQNPTG